MYWVEYLEQKPTNHLYVESGFKTIAHPEGISGGFSDTAAPEVDFFVNLNISAFLKEF
jgi:hypothetical protein